MVSFTPAHPLTSLFLSYRQPILVTYSLTFLENLFELFYPLATGIAIDGLLRKDYTSLIPVFSAWVAHTIVGIFRQVYDTKTFTQIYSNLATAIVLHQSKRGVPTSQIIARSALSHELVDFFERDIPSIMAALFGFLGALLMLFFYDLQIGFYCIVMLVPLWILNQVYAKKTKYLNHKLNNQVEREVQILTDCNPDVIQTHYNLLARWRVRLSNAEAANWGTMEVFIIGLSMLALTRTISIPGIQAGDIFAVVSYLWNYVAILDLTPSLVQRLSRLQDIGNRMQLNDE